jgi:PAS domain S-box-containing protein
MNGVQALGYTREEFTGMGPADIDAELTPEQILQNFALILERGEAVFETRHRHRNGGLRDVRVSARRIRIHDNDYITAIWSDVSERKKQAVEIENQRRFLGDLVENSSLQIYVKDRDGRYELVNRAFETLSDRRRETVLGRTDVEVFPGGDGERFRQNDLAVVRSGKSQTFEETISVPDGTRRSFISTKFPVRNAAGEVTGLCGMTLEITDRKRAEAHLARLATVVEQTTEAIVITDLQAQIQYVNPAFERITGYNRLEVIGKNPRILKSGKHDARFYRQMWETLERGETWSGHFINRRKDGTSYEEDAVISPIRNPDGKVVNYVAAKHDVTREIQLESQFRQAQKMEAMGTLAGGIAHDFNNILTVIFGYAYMLQHATAQDADLQEKVGELLKAAGRAKDLVQQILTFSRKREQKRQIVPLDSVVKEATKFLRSSLPASIRLETDLSPEAPAVLADPTQIYQVVMNLATNALHAMEGRPGRLTVTLAAFTPDAEFLRTHIKFKSVTYARLTVADNGHGMDAPTLERIFEPFFTTKPVGQGTGLGLAVVHGIMESHEGVVNVESQPGQGTTFHLYFPGRQADDCPKVPGIEDVPLGRGQKILVLDDELEVAVTFQRLLKLLNYQAIISTNPHEAITLFRANPEAFDLVITDLAMPDLNGVEVARQLRAIRPHTPILLVSGSTAIESMADFRGAGISDLMVKPVSIAALAEVIHRHVSR